MKTTNTVSLNINTFLEKFNAYYNFLYENCGRWDYQDEIDNFDRMMEKPHFQQFVGEFANFRGDFISSDREAAAFFLAFYDMTHPEQELWRNLETADCE